MLDDRGRPARLVRRSPERLLHRSARSQRFGGDGPLLHGWSIRRRACLGLTGTTSPWVDARGDVLAGPRVSTNRGTGSPMRAPIWEGADQGGRSGCFGQGRESRGDIAERCLAATARSAPHPNAWCQRWRQGAADVPLTPSLSYPASTAATDGVTAEVLQHQTAAIEGFDHLGSGREDHVMLSHRVRESG